MRAGGYEGYDFSKGAGFDDGGWDFGSGALAAQHALVALFSCALHLSPHLVTHTVRWHGMHTGAGFYVNATQEPWSANFHMYDYITKELPEVVAANFASHFSILFRIESEEMQKFPLISVFFYLKRPETMLK